MCGAFERSGGLLLDLIEPNGRLEHEQDFESLFSNVGNDAGDLRRLGDALMNGLAQLLNQLFEFLIQIRTSISRGRAIPDEPYLIF